MRMLVTTEHTENSLELIHLDLFSRTQSEFSACSLRCVSSMPVEAARPVDILGLRANSDMHNPAVSQKSTRAE